MTDPTFPDLNAEQANGHMCVERTCLASFVEPGAPDHVPVGTSITGDQVFACEHRCAPSLGYVEPSGEQMELQS